LEAADHAAKAAKMKCVHVLINDGNVSAAPLAADTLTPLTSQHVHFTALDHAGRFKGTTYRNNKASNLAGSA
jgi:hypothetical protein